MPRDAAEGPDAYPTREDALAYLAQYEQRYAIPVERPARVDAVHRDGDQLRLDTSAGSVRARAVVSATGTWANPVIPRVLGQDRFGGDVLHSARYPGPHMLAGRRVVVVGGGNSGAQIAAELSSIATVTWATREPPHFLPDEVDGRYIFEQATARYRAIQEGRTPDPPRSLGDVVMIPSVREARARGALHAVPMFTRFTDAGVVLSDGREEHVDAVIFATGFRPALQHLAPLGLIGGDGRVAIQAGGSGTRAVGEPRLWLVGYGEWTGFASSTLIGVGRSARATVQELSQ
jgi:cation diffusion facilitator CzcD-associated flavoprotein CzcO